MNCNPYDTENNLIDLFQKLYNRNFKDNDWQKYIKFIKTPDSLQEISDSDLSLIYSASDVGLSTSIAENICFPNIEHASFGKPQIVPKSSSFLYIFKNDSGSIRLKPYLTDSFKESLIYPYGKVWYNEFATQMSVCYENNHFLKNESRKSEEFFSKYSWENSSIKLIKSIYDL
jgi:glycosyltransferase involved in cell wall biosynthesis